MGVTGRVDGVSTLVTATATAGETTGVASRWTFGTMVVWGVVALFLLYLAYRRLA